MGYLRINDQRRDLIVPAMKLYKVGWRAFLNATPPVILAVSFDVIPATSLEEAMKAITRRVPLTIGHPGCEVGIRYVKEKINVGSHISDNPGGPRDAPRPAAVPGAGERPAVHHKRKVRKGRRSD